MTAIRIAWKSFVGLVPPILSMVGIIGLVMALLPDGAIRTLFAGGGITGLILISVVGAVTLMPAFVAFPLAASLLEAGAGFTPVATFIATLTMVGIVTAPMEAEFFGRRFTVVRNGVSYLLALVVGLLLGGILQ